MTTDTLALRSPDAFVASLPYLLGFQPHESCVVAWLIDGRVELTQRLDLPDRLEQRDPWMRALWGHALAATADELIAVFVTEREVDDALRASFLAEAESRGCRVRDALVLRGGAWRSMLCDDDECCPPEGRSPDPSTADAVRAEFALLGRAPLASRAVLEEQFAPDDLGAQEVGRAVEVPRVRKGARRERWRDAAIEAVAQAWGEDDPASASATARVLVALGDTRVRDTVLWDLSRSGGQRTAAQSATRMLAVAPRGLAAPIGTCCAIAWWLVGDGARARLAVQRALEDDADYTLAQMVDAALAGGLPPAAWRAAMDGTTRTECRHGLGAG